MSISAASLQKDTSQFKLVKLFLSLTTIPRCSLSIIFLTDFKAEPHSLWRSLVLNWNNFLTMFLTVRFYFLYHLGAIWKWNPEEYHDYDFLLYFKPRLSSFFLHSHLWVEGMLSLDVYVAQDEFAFTAFHPQLLSAGFADM